MSFCYFSFEHSRKRQVSTLQVVLTNRIFHFFKQQNPQKYIKFKLNLRQNCLSKIGVFFRFHVFYSAILYKGTVRYALTLTWKPMTKLGMTHMQTSVKMAAAKYNLQI